MFKQHSDPDNILFIPGHKNAADCCTKLFPQTTKSILESDRWRLGEFLHLPMEDWPTEKIEPEAKVDDLDGLISRYKGKTELLGNSEGQKLECTPSIQHHPFNIKPVEKNAALISSMLTKHKPNYQLYMNQWFPTVNRVKFILPPKSSS